MPSVRHRDAWWRTEGTSAPGARGRRAPADPFRTAEVTDEAATALPRTAARAAAQRRADRRAMAQPRATPARATRPPVPKAVAIAHESGGAVPPA